jgi:hypothetical protein
MASSSPIASLPEGEPRQAAIELVVIGIVAAFAAAVVTRSYDVAGGLLVVAILFPPTMLLLRRAWFNEDDPVVRRLFVAGAVAKLGGVALRYVVAFSLYGGTADAEAYHVSGAVIAQELRQGQLTHVAIGHGSIIGTNAIELITGLVYTITGATKVGGFVAFAWLGYWGAFMCYRAFKIAMPRGRHRLYAGLIFLMPSMVFWPSSLGKEAIMIFGLGLSLLGIARLLRHLPRAFPVLVAGLFVTGIVRPHITLLTIIATLGAYFRLDPEPGTRRRPLIARVPAFLVLLVLSVLALAAVGSKFNVDPTDTASISGIAAQASAQTSEGGSEFKPVALTNPLAIIPAVFTVLYRPTVLEASGLQVAAVASECTALLLLTIFALRRMRLRTLIGDPYARLALVYVGLFCFAFSSFANFGILARQRVQTLPLLFVLLALPDKEVADEPAESVGDLDVERR